MHKRSKKGKGIGYQVWVGVAVVITLLAVLLAFVDSSGSSKRGGPTSADQLVNDRSTMGDIDSKAEGNFTTAASPFFDKWTIGDLKYFAGTRISNMVDMPGAVKRCEVSEDGMEKGVIPPAFDARKNWPGCFEHEVYDSKA